MGEVFAGRYELVDPIGRGGVGAVWRAWDQRRRRYVAAKVLQQSDAHALLRFVREQALRIDHPHVLAPASWAADDDKVLFTMDLVAGGSLVHLVNDYGPLPPPFVCTLLDQLLAGAAAVHAEGVVHRDIKPANILLEATGTARPRLRLSDFGIAMRLGEPRLTETNYVVGTPGYFAPEQMMGAEPDFPADLFAVGLVALYLLEGARPDAKALIEYFAENGTPPAPQSIPEPLWQVVATLLQPDPRARFRTATGARKALASAAELLPEPGPDDELVEVFDQLGPLPPGFGPEGPLRATTARAAEHTASSYGSTSGTGTPSGTGSGTGSGTASGSGPHNSGSWRHESGALSREPVSGAAWTDPSSEGSWPASGSGAAGPTSDSGGVWPASDSGGVRPEPVPGDVRHEPAPRAVRHESAPHAVPPHLPPDATPPQPSTMSDTGSFHLPPPQPRTQSPWQPDQPPTPPTSVMPPAPSPAYAPPFDDTSTQLPSPVRSTDSTVATHQHAQPRTGPPAKVAVPLLLLALACFAVGFWALTQI
ncbi:protein kinase [Streptomyces sp. NBC_01549]|uniref:serine/threonine-protein kinase n=1 Tax=Streptomyces sp. NBC_01549 TaxID=2975874 RepID=UPI002255F9C9|nr:serine/threonine protein kinase [Streptomyces sp. NBC_01549]MCX4590683.1 protein kinase [Streptomyces sp. NBC_01549]